MIERPRNNLLSHNFNFSQKRRAVPHGGYYEALQTATPGKWEGRRWDKKSGSSGRWYKHNPDDEQVSWQAAVI